MFLQWFPSKHNNLHICRHKAVPEYNVLQCFQFPYLPKPSKIPLLIVFSSFFPCSNAAGQLKHTNKKSFQNIVFHSVFAILPVKNTVIYTFLAIKSVQDTSFCNVLSALAPKNLSEYRYLQCFFTSRRFLHCRKPTKMTKNSMSIPSSAQTPKNRWKMTKTPNSGLGRFCPPPPS